MGQMRVFVLILATLIASTSQAGLLERMGWRSRSCIDIFKAQPRSTAVVTPKTIPEISTATMNRRGFLRGLGCTAAIATTLGPSALNLNSAPLVTKSTEQIATIFSRRVKLLHSNVFAGPGRILESIFPGFDKADVQTQAEIINEFATAWIRHEAAGVSGGSAAHSLVQTLGGSPLTRNMSGLMRTSLQNLTPLQQTVVQQHHVARASLPLDESNSRLVQTIRKRGQDILDRFLEKFKKPVETVTDQLTEQITTPLEEVARTPVVEEQDPATLPPRPLTPQEVAINEALREKSIIDTEEAVRIVCSLCPENER